MVFKENKRTSAKFEGWIPILRQTHLLERLIGTRQPKPRCQLQQLDALGYAEFRFEEWADGWVGWVGLGWVGLGWVGLGWVGLGWVGLGWVGLGLRIELVKVGIGCWQIRSAQILLFNTEMDPMHPVQCLL